MKFSDGSIHPRLSEPNTIIVITDLPAHLKEELFADTEPASRDPQSPPPRPNFIRQSPSKQSAPEDT